MRRVVLGDPQAPFAHVMALLERGGVLDGDRLRSDVELISIGDHFDYDLRQPEVSREEGLRVLRWLASHEQVRLIFGNHDAARVIELATTSDREFAAARALALDIEQTKHDRGRAAAKQRETEEWLPRYAHLSTYGIVARDYASFSEEQRALVVELMLAGRFHLALDGKLPDGRAAVLTHAGLTTKEKIFDAAVIDQYFTIAVEGRRADWEAGVITPLSLEPLVRAGGPGIEAGGMLAHRPSDPDRDGADPIWERDPRRPRRFAPSELPPITQICGHTNHASCLRELGRWATPQAKAQRHAGIRTLRWDGHEAIYDLGILPTQSGVADLILVDGELRDPANRAELLDLAW
ncbi:MAG: metallophosphoesterase family protein [Kofleriaceae bacterium]